MKRFLIICIQIIATSFAFATSPSGTIPVLYVNTEGNQEIISKEDYLPATCWLDAGDSQFESLGSQENPVVLQIKGRGNYTWIGFDKKPYKLKFDKKTEIMGMGKNKHFALLAHADDNLGFLRNITGLKLSRMLDLNWTPADQPLELVINGEYKGLYFLTETIRVDNNRVNITEMEDNATDDVTGGWLLEIDNYDTDPHVSITEGNGQRIIFTYKSPEILSAQQETYLKEQMNLLNSTIYGDKNSNALFDILDLDQAARYYIVQEILDDCESYHGSCYLHKDKGTDKKWTFGPVWDFGNAFYRDGKNQFIWQNPSFNQTWIGEIYKFPAFQAKVKEVWKELCDNELSDLDDYLQEYTARYAQAAAVSAERWPQYGNNDIKSKLKVMIDRLNNSLKWLGQQWDYTAPVLTLPTQIYLRGSFNSWATTHPFELQSNGKWILKNVSLQPNDEIKLADESWQVIDLGASESASGIEEETPYPLTVKGPNIKVKNTISGLNAIYDPAENTLLLTSSSSVDMTVADVDMKKADIYTIDGKRVLNMEQPGIYILRQGSRTVKIMK